MIIRLIEAVRSAALAMVSSLSFRMTTAAKTPVTTETIRLAVISGQRINRPELAEMLHECMPRKHALSSEGYSRTFQVPRSHFPTDDSVTGQVGHSSDVDPNNEGQIFEA
jgi:hypothetical protein